MYKHTSTNDVKRVQSESKR